MATEHMSARTQIIKEIEVLANSMDTVLLFREHYVVGRNCNATPDPPTQLPCCKKNNTRSEYTCGQGRLLQTCGGVSRWAKLSRQNSWVQQSIDGVTWKAALFFEKARDLVGLFERAESCYGSAVNLSQFVCTNFLIQQRRSAAGKLELDLRAVGLGI